MVPIDITCNLDIIRDNYHRLKWSDKLPARPIPGDIIRCDTLGEGGRYIELEVYRCTWVPHKALTETPYWELQVELHLVKTRSIWQTIPEFEDWVKRHWRI